MALPGDATLLRVFVGADEKSQRTIGRPRIDPKAVPNMCRSGSRRGSRFPVLQKWPTSGETHDQDRFRPGA